MIRTALFFAIAALGIAAFPPDAGSNAPRAASRDAICWIEFAPGALRHYCRESGVLLVCAAPRQRCRALPEAIARN